jgi:hypothetical protein
LHRLVETAGQVFADQGVGDIRWLEDGLRTCANQGCLQILLGLLNSPSLRVPGDTCRQGERKVARVRRTLHTLFGEGEVFRSWYKHPGEEGRFPLDEALGLINGHTPRLAGLMGRAAARAPFEQASSDFREYTGLEVCGRQFQRLASEVGAQTEAFLRADHGRGREKPPRVYVLMDGTGAPLRKAELKGRRGKAPDGSAKTHEVKVAALFTQHPKPGEEPWRDLDTTTYVATEQRCDDFGGRVRREFLRRFANAPEIVVLGDAAAWINTIARQQFAGAVRVVDWHHGAERVATLAELVAPRHTPRWHDTRKKWTSMLWRGKVDALAWAVRSQLPADSSAEGEKQLAYFLKNREAMRYDVFRSQGIFIGSGVVEAACKTIVAQRFKASGMRWSSRGLKPVLAIRTALLSGRYEDFWAWREARKKAA